MRPRSEVWEFYDTRKTDGKIEAICKYCGTIYHNALATRLREHLAKCTHCPQTIKRMTPEPSQRRSKKLRRTSEVDDSPTTSFCIPSPTFNDGLSSDKASVAQANSDSPANVVADDEVDEAIARAVYASGASLSMLESKYWRNAFQLIRPGYGPPNHHILSGILLNAEYQRVHAVVTKKIENSDALCLISDGWTDLSGHNVVNFVVTTPEPIFVKSIRPGDQRESAQFIASSIISVIDEIGNEKFVAVITDNARNMQAAWRIIGDKYKHITCIGCAAHSINLLIKDIMTLEVLQELLQESKKIIKAFKFSHIPHVVFENIQKEKYGNSCVPLKLPTLTHWTSVLMCFESLLKNKEALLETVVCPTVQFDRTIKTSVQADDTWEKLEEACRLLLPMSAAIIRIEADNAVLSDIHDQFSEISKEVDQLLRKSSIFSPRDQLIIRSAIVNMHESTCKPIHAAANMLDPRYKGIALSTDDDSQALDYITVLSNVLGHDSGIIMANLAVFRANDEFFSRDSLWVAAQHVSPSTWWKGLCGKQPLSSLASKLLNIPPSSAASERNWLAHGQIHTKLRNRLSPATTKKLISIQWNLLYKDDFADSQGSSITVKYRRTQSSSDEESE